MKIVITQKSAGNYDVQSEFPGPMTTIQHLEAVIQAIKNGAANAEIQASSKIEFPNAAQVRQLNGQGRT